MRFGIDCALSKLAEANKSIYFNYNYRLRCSLDLHSADSLPYCAVLLPCGLLQSLHLRLSRAWPSAHYFCSGTRPFWGGLLRRIFFGQLLKNEMVLHIVIRLVSGGILHHVSRRIFCRIRVVLLLLGAEKDFH